MLSRLPEERAGQAVLEVDGLKVTFVRRDRELPVLKGVSLRIEPGPAHGIVGESGCGKTTLALALLRYLPPNGASTPTGDRRRRPSVERSSAPVRGARWPWSTGPGHR
jgi:ABC-type glutathione transport system ATPase component